MWSDASSIHTCCLTFSTALIYQLFIFQAIVMYFVSILIGRGRRGLTWIKKVSRPKLRCAIWKDIYWYFEIVLWVTHKNPQGQVFQNIQDSQDDQETKKNPRKNFNRMPLFVKKSDCMSHTGLNSKENVSHKINRARRTIIHLRSLPSENQPKKKINKWEALKSPLPPPKP